MPNKDWSEFTPPPGITHWKRDKDIAAEDFWDKYIGVGNINDKDEFSFLTGYYVHLLTDIEWTKMMRDKMESPLYKDELSKDPNFIWTIKKDWYGLDFIYIDKNPECLFHKCFKHIESVPDYLDYFPPKAFEAKVKFITDYYLGENEETKDNFIYLNEEEMNKFVDSAANNISDILRKKGITGCKQE
jgi:hypothetical protein